MSYLRRNCHHNKYLQNHVNKYGVDDLVFEILEVIFNTPVLLMREQYYIDKLMPKFNISKVAGNTLGTKRNQKTRQLISRLKMGNKHNVGRKLDDEHKLNISKANKGRKFTEEHKAKIRSAAMNRSPESREKYRQARIGKKLSETTKQKISQATKGKNNPRWKGGISKTYQRRQGGLCEC